ncbi:PAP2 superfamily protein [Chishuiella changwenlii]|uniref:PAP2 superfamily protein n=1 Tax=Chishuiella changwenlii TaxID=1434701 RepID=A0A1M7AL22_9FLAO|nr:phosphatase PAP2 family protein [Chishuiella changwenlii]GGE90560.1 phospholipid phosphatase [Chishuiella changwenlii]SHL43109.1 PAP2 superfamily protein [Chishuiella changwenlii]
MFSRIKNIIIVVLIGIYQVQAQDSIYRFNNSEQDSIVVNQENNYKLNYKHLIAPTVLIGFGIVGLESDGLKQLNLSTRNEINEHQPKHISLDNYTQFAPALMVYGLNAFGVKGKHNFRDRTIIYTTSQLISAAFVVPLKHLTNEERPDKSNRLSFPSGHTAIAFSSAQFMFREYRDTNFWLSISGYSFAVFTGIYRMVNDKHWINDVVAGAGCGILSTELAYFLYPKINGLLLRKEKKSTTMIAPFYQNKSFGIGLVKSF